MIPAIQMRGVAPMIVLKAPSRSAGMSSAAGSASTRIPSRIEAMRGTKPIATRRFAVSRPYSSATALDVMTSIRKAKMPASTASGPSATCLLASTPAMQTMPP
jgi:hypothetical protein